MDGDGMKRLVVLVVAAAVLLGSCGTQRIGEMQRESQTVDLENAQSVVADLRMGAGELNVTGGSDAMMEADFSYNVAEWEPEVSYDVSGDTGELIVEQGSGEGVPVGGDARNEWEVRLNERCRPTFMWRWAPGRATWTWTASP